MAEGNGWRGDVAVFCVQFVRVGVAWRRMVWRAVGEVHQVPQGFADGECGQGAEVAWRHFGFVLSRAVAMRRRTQHVLILCRCRGVVEGWGGAIRDCACVWSADVVRGLMLRGFRQRAKHMLACRGGHIFAPCR